MNPNQLLILQGVLIIMLAMLGLVQGWWMRRLRRDVAYWAQSFRAQSEDLDAVRLRWISRHTAAATGEGGMVMWDVSIEQLMSLARLHGPGTTIYPYGDAAWWLTNPSQIHVLWSRPPANRRPRPLR